MNSQYSFQSDPPTYEQWQTYTLPGAGLEQDSLINGPSPGAKPTAGNQSTQNVPLSKRATKVKSALRQHWINILWTVLASVSFSVTAWFARATLSMARVAELQQTVHLSLSNTLGILRALQEVTSVLTGFIINQTFEVIEWSLVSGRGGTRALSFLTLSPTTSLLGVAGVAFGLRGKTADRMWAIFRLMMVAVVWAAGFVLFFNTNADIVYLPDATYYITSGVGVFNSSLVQPSLDALNHRVPYVLQSLLYNGVTNTEISVQGQPVSCLDESICDSYLLPGSLGGSAPWPPGGSPQSPVVAIWDAPAVQYEFRNGIDSSDSFLQGDCDVIGGGVEYILAVQVCIAESKAYPGSIIVELYICTNGTNASNECLNEGPTLNMSATLSIYQRQATTVNARSNGTILSVPEIGPPTQVTNTNITALRMAVSWLLDYNAAGIPPASAFMTIFWDSRLQIANAEWSVLLTISFQSMLVIPMWYFSVSNYGNPQVQQSPTTLIPNLPPEFTTTASLARPYSKITINTDMFYAYLGLELGALVVSWLVIVAILWRGKAGPVVSSYPLIDFAAKTAPSNVPQGADGIESRLRDLTGADSKRIRSQLSATKMYLRINATSPNSSGISNEKSVVLVTTGRSSGLESLREGNFCR